MRDLSTAVREFSNEKQDKNQQYIHELTLHRWFRERLDVIRCTRYQKLPLYRLVASMHEVHSQFSQMQNPHSEVHSVERPSLK
jgi:hypothetical protein